MASKETGDTSLLAAAIQEVMTIGAKVPRIVAAIDLGTTNSGYAFQLRHDYEADPVNTIHTSNWGPSGQDSKTTRTPTVLLLNPDRTFHSFGNEAVRHYADRILDKSYQEWYFFRLFKVKLHNETELTMETSLEDETGKHLKAMTVISLCIKHLKDHLLARLQKQGTSVNDEQMKWVITVPAIWKDSAKIFIRQAAIKAGISDRLLTISLDPEAASLYYHQLASDKPRIGEKYMAVDVGGDFVDIIVHQKLEDGSLKEVRSAVGGDWGGMAVNRAFFELLEKLIGTSAMQIFTTKFKTHYMDLGSEFESEKKTADVKTKKEVNVKIPEALSRASEEANGEDITSVLSKSNCPYREHISIIGDRMHIDTVTMAELYKSAIEKITAPINQILGSIKTNDVKYLLLVGGFAECHWLQEVVNKTVTSHGLQVIVPTEADLCNLKGAVIYGQDPSKVRHRVLRYTYGVETNRLFIEGKDPTEKKVQKHGKAYCSDAFETLIEAGTCVEVGQAVNRECSTAYKGQTVVMLQIFASTENSPRFVTDHSCSLIGTLTIKVIKPTPELQHFDVKYVFGDTELMIQAFIKGSTIPCEAKFGIP